MPTADQGVATGYSALAATPGEGITSGPTPVFVGVQAGQGDPTLQGYVKKRPVLGDTTVLDQLQ